MIVSVEVSVYPLSEDYKPTVKAFIKKIAENQQIKMKVNGISTHLFGELSEIMSSLEGAIASVLDQKKASVVIKLLPTDLSEYEYKG